MSHDKIHIPHVESGRVLKFECKAEELFQYFTTAYHTNNYMNLPITQQPASVAYAFGALGMIWRFKLLSDEDFKFLTTLPLTEQFSIAARYTRVCYEIAGLPYTANTLIKELEQALREHQRNTD